MKAPVVISLGGSVIAPTVQETGCLNVVLLKAFKAFIQKEVKKGKRFIIVAGGGKICRVYQKDVSLLQGITKEDLDWIGIQATKLNATVVRAFFGSIAYSKIIDRKPLQKEVRAMEMSQKKIFIACGWEPGQSSDHEAVVLARLFGAKEVINASNVEYVYDKDPGKHKEAKPVQEISWREYRKIIPSVWTPGLGTPFDPIASRLAEKYGIAVKIVLGTDISRLEKAVDGESFLGTLIRS